MDLAQLYYIQRRYAPRCVSCITLIYSSGIMSIVMHTMHDCVNSRLINYTFLRLADINVLLECISR